jgi:hypothetical protein
MDGPDVERLGREWDRLGVRRTGTEVERQSVA